MTITADDLVPEQLWQAIGPLLPGPPRRYGGRPRVDDRACLAGIVDQLRTGIPWRLLPTRRTPAQVDDRSLVRTSVVSAGPCAAVRCPPAGVRPAHLPQSPDGAQGRSCGIRLIPAHHGVRGRGRDHAAVRW